MLTKTLSSVQRPVVNFDPTNAQHRYYFKKFVQTHSWKGCPFLFSIEDNSLDVVSYISKKMLAYYFKNDKAISSKPVAKTKAKKVVKLKKVINE